MKKAAVRRSGWHRCLLWLALISPVMAAAPVADTAPESPEAAAPETAEALRARIRDLVRGMRDVPLPLIVEALSGCRVLPWDGECGDALAEVAADVRASINRGGVSAGRVNEAGNLVERYVERALRRHGFAAGVPVAASGRARAAGYPDLEAGRDGCAFYIEVKTYSAKTRASTQRSFYLSPSADFKVTRDAHHLLIAVELEVAARGLYRAASVRWYDLSGLRCDLKHEFNASNRDLYGGAGARLILER